MVFLTQSMSRQLSCCKPGCCPALRCFRWLQVSRLVEACQKQGAEAGRLQPRGASEALVQEYNVLKEALQGLLHGR